MADFKFLAIKNWERYQVHDRKKRDIRLYIKDYCAKDMDDRDYASLTFYQRYVWDACCRLRGRTGRNLHNDATWIARALCAVGTDRPHVGHAIDTLVARGFLILTNQEVSLSDPNTDTDSESEPDTDAQKSVAGQLAAAVVAGKTTPVVTHDLECLSSDLGNAVAIALFHTTHSPMPVLALLQSGVSESDIRKAIDFLPKSNYWGKPGKGALPDTAAFCRAFPAILKARNNYYAKEKHAHGTYQLSAVSQ